MRYLYRCLAPFFSSRVMDQTPSGPFFSSVAPGLQPLNCPAMFTRVASGASIWKRTPWGVEIGAWGPRIPVVRAVITKGVVAQDRKRVNITKYKQFRTFSTPSVGNISDDQIFENNFFFTTFSHLGSIMIRGGHTLAEQRTKVVFFVRGMTCASCEKRIEKVVLSLENVYSAKAHQSTGKLEVEFNGEPNKAAVSHAITTSGYIVADNQGKETGIILALGIILAAIYFIGNAFGIFNFIPPMEAGLGLGMLFLAGLVTSLHCVAMCGGIALSQQARVADVNSRSFWVKNKPGLLYHGGRVVSYTLIGGVIGSLGSLVSLSPLSKGIFFAAAGILMVLLGVKMLGIFPWLDKVKIKLPRIIPGLAMAKFRGKGPFFVGLANGFMPCGPLQTMQLYALGTGSALMGALSMMVFSLGTVPLMFAFGALSQFFNREWQLRLVKVSALLVVLFGSVMTLRAFEITGFSGNVATALTPPEVSETKSTEEVQYVSFDLRPGYYQPITVKKGIPVKWTINASEESLNGCNYRLIIPSLGLGKTLAPGVNLIEFTPQTAGIISYTCWMGMISSSIKVLEN